MNRFLLGALAMGAVFVLTSFALTRPPAATGGPAWTVSQYQLDRAFRTTLILPGTSGQAQLHTFQMPATGGIIITQVRSISTISIDVNGVAENLPPVSTGDFLNLNPPIIVHPNDVVTLLAPGTVPFVFAGFTTLPGET